MLELEGPETPDASRQSYATPPSSDISRQSYATPTSPAAGEGRLCVGPLPTAAIAQARLILLTAADDALEPLARRLADEAPPSPSTPVLHCSGSLNSTVLAALAGLGIPTGSMHPLQSFSGMPVHHGLRGTWFALEGHDLAVSVASRVVAWLEGREVRLRPEGKVFYHASAVVASNLMVALTALAVDLMEQATGPEVDGQRRLELLLPLIEGTVANLRRVGLPGALTGPVSRGDAGVVAKHLEAIAGKEKSPDASSSSPDRLLIYRELSKQALQVARAQGLSTAACEAIEALLTGKAADQGRPG